jgi:hypothetical protein
MLNWGQVGAYGRINKYERKYERRSPEEGATSNKYQRRGGAFG